MSYSKENSNNKPFKIPEGFFEKQRSEILSATSERHSVSKKRVLSIKLSRSLALAASLTAIGFLVTVWTNKSIDKCISFACLLESTDFNDLNKEEYETLELWQEELTEEEYESL
ncbi:MAG TPA: hypothetical protein EYF95_06630 [Flavobacteriales bacterium]|nr:hypothetical protein [Flavobacteriales bacterium]